MGSVIELLNCSPAEHERIDTINKFGANAFDGSTLDFTDTHMSMGAINR
jgi:hypothetical protein